MDSDARMARLWRGDPVRLWLLSRLAMVALTWIVAWTGFGSKGLDAHGLASIWQHWDWLRYQGIAATGDQFDTRHGASYAFFPGYPALAWASIALAPRTELRP